MTHNSAPCFCCSELPFSECCEPVLQDHARALTPQALMRSRYTAYVIENEKHLLTTWDPSTRPASISFEHGKVKWLGLTLHSCSEEGNPGDRGQVEFTASFIENDQLCRMHETSNFIRNAGLWFYLDGSCELKRETLGRNATCPCGSGKKFKRCHGRKAAETI